MNAKITIFVIVAAMIVALRNVIICFLEEKNAHKTGAKPHWSRLPLPLRKLKLTDKVKEKKEEKKEKE